LPARKPLRFPSTLSVKINRVVGKMHFHFSPPPSSRIWYGFYEEPEVRIDVDTEIGVKGVKNFPKIASIIIYKIKKEIIELMVLPQMDDLPIPNIKKEEKKEEKKENQSSSPVIRNIEQFNFDLEYVTKQL